MDSKHLLGSLFFLLLLVISACNSSSTVTGLSATSGSNSDSGSSSSTSSAGCVTDIIDAGSKQAVAAVARGVVSDVRINPANSRESFAYYDTGAQGIKFSYWNGTKYVHEYVAGYPTAANNIDFGYLSSGIPVIVWTAANTQLMVATRSASTSATSTIQNGASWSSKVVASIGTSNRGVRISISPNDMVGGGYLTDTLTAGRPKFFYCASGCNNVNNYYSMSGAQHINNQNILAAQLQTGFGWCKQGASTYYPVVSYTSAASPVGVAIATCQQASAANCLVTANWTVVTAPVVAAISPLVSALHIDSTVVGDPVKVGFLKTAVGLKTYLSGTPGTPVGCSSLIAGSTFTESTQTLGSVNTGNLWIDMARDSGGRMHIVANDSTTSVLYFNTANGTIGNWATWWNTIAGGTLNTTNVAASQGGMAMDTTTGTIYSTHYSSTAANRFNFILNKISDSSSTPALTTSGNTFVNQDGHLELTTANTKNIQVDKTSYGTVGAVYVDNSLGAAGNGVLKYAYRSGSTVSSSWSIITIPSVTAPIAPSIRYDANDKLWISYFDTTNVRFYLMTNTSADGTGTWSQYLFTPYNAGQLTYNAALPAKIQTSIAIYKNGTTTYPVLVVLNPNPTGATTAGVIEAALFNSTTLTWNTKYASGTYAEGSEPESLDAWGDSSGNITIAFLDKVSNSLTYGVSSNITGATPTFTLFAIPGVVAGAGQGIQLRVNSVYNTPFIYYHDYTNNRLYRSVCSNSVATCATTGGWTTTSIDFATGMSSYTAVTQSFMRVGIALRSTGAYDVLYSEAMGSTGNWIHAKYDSADTALSTTNYVLTQGGTLVNNASQFGVMGLNGDAVITSGDQLVGVYLGFGNLLAHKSCDLTVSDP